MKACGLARRDAGLLRLLAGVHLHEELRVRAAAFHLGRQRLGQLRPVERMDGVEQRHRVLRLVGLQRPDEMQLDGGDARAQRGQFRLRPPARGSRRTPSGPAAIAGTIRSRSCVFVTAIRCVAAAGATAAFRAASMRARMAARLMATLAACRANLIGTASMASVEERERLASAAARLNAQYLQDIARQARGAPHLPALILMTDEVRLPDPLAAVSALPKGSAVIVRHSDANARRTLAETLLPVAHENGISAS